MAFQSQFVNSRQSSASPNLLQRCTLIQLSKSNTYRKRIGSSKSQRWTRQPVACRTPKIMRHHKSLRTCVRGLKKQLREEWLLALKSHIWNSSKRCCGDSTTREPLTMQSLPWLRKETSSTKSKERFCAESRDKFSDTFNGVIYFDESFDEATAKREWN